MSHAAGSAAYTAARAAAAAVASDLVGKHGLTAEHIATLTREWLVIVGRVA